MERPFNIYCTGHKHSLAVCEAMHQGTRLPMVPPAPLLGGGVATYGFLRGILPTLNEARSLGREWVYADRGYFQATYGDDHSGFFRLSRNRWQHSGEGEPDFARWKALGLKIDPWRKGGEHILVCPPGDVFSGAVGGFSSEAWIRTVLSTLYKITERPVRVRLKSETGRRPLAADLKECHALVTYMSNTAVQALLAGVPVFCNESCAAFPMGGRDLGEIENPPMPEGREVWAATLAANQWTLEEIRAGHANRIFQ